MRVLLFVLLTTFLLPAVGITQHLFLKVEGIDGSATAPGHERWIETFAFSGGAANSGSTHAGGGTGVGKANIQDYSFTICVDKSSTKLREAVQKGTIIPKVTFEVSRLYNNNKPVVTYRIVMEKVLVSSISEGGSIGEGKFTLNVSFNFAKYKNSYYDVDGDGKVLGTYEAGWDIEKAMPY